MNRLRSLALLVIVLSLLATAAPLGAAERRTFSVSLQYTTGDGRPRTALVPHAALTTVDMPIQISDGKLWLVTIGVDEAEGTFVVVAVDPALVTPGFTPQLFNATFKLANGKPVTLLKTISGTLEVTVTMD